MRTELESRGRARTTVVVCAIVAAVGTGSCRKDCPPSGPATGGTGVLLVGHSQVNHEVPGYLAWMREVAGAPGTVERQVILGGNLEEAYVLHAKTTDVHEPALDPAARYAYFPERLSAKGADALVEIDSGAYGSVVITEEHALTQAQARQPAFMAEHGVVFPASELAAGGEDDDLLAAFQPTHGIASGLGLYDRAVEANRHAGVTLYENMFPVVNGATHCARLGVQPTKTLAELNSWRARVLAYAPAWQGLATEMNRRRGAHVPDDVPGFSYGTTQVTSGQVSCGLPVSVIPFARALSVLTERICAGAVGSLRNPNQLWSDNVHMSQLGNFFVATVLLAGTTGQSPAGIVLDGTRPAPDGSLIVAPGPIEAAAMQAIAWDVVSGAAQASDAPILSCDLGAISLPEVQFCGDPLDQETIPLHP